MAVFDTTMLLCFLEPDAKAPHDPETNEPVTDARARIDVLIERLDSKRETVVIPTPVLSEALAHAGYALHSSNHPSPSAVPPLGVYSAPTQPS